MHQDLATFLQTFIYPLVVTVVLWGGLTAGLLSLNRRGLGAGRLALVGLGLALIVAHQQLWATRDDLSVLGSYRAFVAGMLIWTWHELAFYSGVITGPWAKPCPPEARGWQRFWFALGTHLYHELAMLLEAIALVILLWGGQNWIGPATIALSWALQHSAKLNVLLGVRFLQVDLFPAHLRYLGSYWRSRPSNPLFVPTIIVATGLALLLWLWATQGQAGYVGAALLASLAALGAFEHLLLMLLPAPPNYSSARHASSE